MNTLEMMYDGCWIVLFFNNQTQMLFCGNVIGSKSNMIGIDPYRHQFHFQRWTIFKKKPGVSKSNSLMETWSAVNPT